MMEPRTDGVIICSSSFSADKGRQLLANEFPIVDINYKANENFNYSICHDDIDGSRQITSHLNQLGHTKIAYLGNTKSGRTSNDRLSGFRKEMKLARIEIPIHYIYEVAGSEPELGEIGLEYFQSLLNQPTAVILLMTW
jgi:DNA-binding LacI/PurR family transcriptional regulator